MIHDKILRAREEVCKYANDHLDPSDGYRVDLDDVHVVWYAYILWNWKAVVSTMLPDEMYYEVTFNDRKGMIYVDAYKRYDRKEIKV